MRAIFISHTHMDHVGGLASLLWNMRKISGRTSDPSRKLTGRNIPVYFPDPEIWQGFKTVLSGSEGGFKIDYTLDACHYEDGVIHRDDHGLRVTALHNLHLGQPALASGGGERWKSFSFRIEAGGQTVVFSGDVKHVSELEPLLQGADLLLMETGHHKVDAVCAYLRDESAFEGQLGFVHHGRAILADPAGELRKAQAILGDDVFIATDGMAMQV